MELTVIGGYYFPYKQKQVEISNSTYTKVIQDAKGFCVVISARNLSQDKVDKLYTLALTEHYDVDSSGWNLISYGFGYLKKELLPVTSLITHKPKANANTSLTSTPLADYIRDMEGISERSPEARADLAKGIYFNEDIDCELFSLLEGDGGSDSPHGGYVIYEDKWKLF